MPTFSSTGVTIAFSDTRPASDQPRGVVLLVHGFASNATTNWVQTGWVRLLVEAGYRVVAFDHRGHGDSDKLYNIEDYGAPLMAVDAINLLDHLGIQQAHFVGYSMGARVSAFALLAHPDRVASAVFGGLGINMVHGMKGRGDTIAEALEAPSLEDVTDPGGRVFRAFAEQTKGDLKSLAACMRSGRVPITELALAGVTKPVLVVVGDTDAVAGSAVELAAIIPGAQSVSLPGRDHMKAVGDRGFKDAVLNFLNAQPDANAQSRKASTA
jgi:pimeloyl-ACP methyl ester carboxylesterase